MGLGRVVPGFFDNPIVVVVVVISAWGDGLKKTCQARGLKKMHQVCGLGKKKEKKKVANFFWARYGMTRSL